MKNTILYIFVLCVLNALIIYGYSLGLNVILYTIPLLLFIYSFLKYNKLIKNKKGLLFMIPIIILSLTYFIYDNVFKYLNVMVIPMLYFVMYIYTMKKENSIFGFIKNTLYLMVKPLEKMKRFVDNVKENVRIPSSEDGKYKQIIKSIIIIIPIVLIVIALLSSADMVFESIFNSFFELIDTTSVEDTIYRLLIILILFLYLGGTCIYLKEYSKTEIKAKNVKIEEYTIKLLLTVLNVIYVVFDIIQINSLMLHRVSQNINYAEYARSGFFQLMFITFINIAIIFASKCCKESKYKKIMSLLMVGLTTIIVFSSFMRMHLYESTYGYTLLRLGVYIILITEIILFIPTCIYILKDKFPILKYYIVIITIVYTMINLYSIENIITANNINRFYETGELDVFYLENNNYDNIAQLVELYNYVSERDNNTNKTTDKAIKNDLGRYLYTMKNNVTINEYSILEYNISKINGLKELHKINDSKLIKEEVSRYIY